MIFSSGQYIRYVLKTIEEAKIYQNTICSLEMNRKDRNGGDHAANHDDEEEWTRDGMDEDEYYVERILQKSIVEGTVRYFVKWRGYPSEQNTWESLDNLQGSQQMLLDFENEIDTVRQIPSTELQRKNRLKKFILDTGKFNQKAHENAVREFYNNPIRTEHDIVDIFAYIVHKNSFVVKYSDGKVAEINATLIQQMPDEKKRIFSEFWDKNREQLIRNMKRYVREIQKPSTSSVL